MELNYQHVMSEKSDAQLEVYLSNPQEYSPEVLESVLAEFKKRGRTLSDSEISAVNNAIYLKRGVYDESVQTKGWQKNITQNPNAPLFYPKWAVEVAAAFLAPIFGAAVLSMNVKKAKPGTGTFLVLGFGLIYTLLELAFILIVSPDINTIIILHCLGAFLLSLFWKKYIGDTRYRAKAPWIPLLIGIAIVVPLLIVYSQRR